MNSRLIVLSLVATLGLAVTAQAHFVWVSAEKDKSGQPVVQVCFSELAEPDSADLLDKITTIQVLGVQADGKPQPLSITKQSIGSGGALVGILPAGTKALSAQIKYGVLTRREQTFLLQYYAKYLDGSAAEFNKLARDERLALDVVPHKTDKGYSIEVLFKGQPVAGSDFVIHDPSANQTEAKSDEKGRVELTTTKPGLYSIRAKWVTTDTGEEGGKTYAQVNHYTTLALRVPQK